MGEEEARFLMSDIVLQHLIMSSRVVDGADALFCRTHASFPISLSPGETADLNCHFNLFHMGIYREHTGCSDYHLRIMMEGEASVIMHGCDGDNIIHIDGDSSIPLPTASDIIGFSIDAVTSCRIVSAEICCSCDKVRDVKVSLCICTYNNDGRIIDKVSRIDSFFKDLDERGPEIVITDNGMTLGRIGGATVIPSGNYGGSAGFTRSMMHAMRNGSDYMILNDDDAVFEPEILYRVMTLLSLTDDEMTIGGTMLCMDDVTRVGESGAKVIGQEHIPLKCGLDLSGIEGNMELAKDGRSDYNGWWFYVIPRRTIEEHGYPLPMFLKNDDVEYGLRTVPDIIRMIGISVWHPSMVSRYSSSIRYYDFRNLLVALCIHDDIIVKKAISDILLEISAYRYLNAEAMMSGLRDYLKGPGYLFGQCIDGMKGLPDEDIRELTVSEKENSTDHGKRDVPGYMFRKYTMNGLFLPSIGERELSAFCMFTEEFYRVGRITYVIDGERGFVARRNRVRTVKDTIRALGLGLSLRRRKRALKRAYRESLPSHSSEDGWKGIFGKDD